MENLVSMFNLPFRFLMVDYGNAETRFFKTEDELKEFVVEISREFVDFTLNEDLEFYDLMTGRMINVETEAKVLVNIV